MVLPAVAECYSDGTCNQNAETDRIFTFRVHDADLLAEKLEELRVKYPALRRYNFSIQSVSEDEKEVLVSPDGKATLLDLSEQKILKFC